MNCPHCGFRFGALAMNAETVPDLAPVICESCAAISLLIDGAIRKATPKELEAIKRSPAWREIIEPVADLVAKRMEQPAPPVDRSQTTLTDGSPVTPDHRELRPDGQQKSYVVLSAAERARGFVRPLRNEYTHLVCGGHTFMGAALAETYARDPGFYGGTFCTTCRMHFPLDQFVWKGTNETVGA